MGFFLCQCFFGFDILLNTLMIGQARAVSTDGLRPSFFTINAVVYVVQVFLQSLRNLSLVFVGSWHILLDVLLPDCSMVGFVVEACSSYGNPI
jgi:hypothetical protein